MPMKVEIKTNVGAWKSLVNEAADKAAGALANQIMNDSIDKIPKSAGDDRTEGAALSDIGRIEKPENGTRNLVWDNVYAGYQWYGMRADGTHVVKNYTTSGTGKMWVETARAENQSIWDKVAQNGFTEGLK